VGNSFIFGPTGMVAIHQKMNNKEEQIFYAHSDHLGSVMGFTDDSGAIVQGSVASFDAWGNRRDPETWQPYTGTPPALLFDRGYTGHEHIEQAGLINMNGRVYDPLVARFLSPDPFIQAPAYSQSFNRYSYVMNDPINLVDRSGYYWEGYDEDYDDYYLDGDYPNVNPPRDDKRWFERLFSELSDAWNEIESIWNDRNDFDESTDFLYTETVDNSGHYFLDDQFEYYGDYSGNDDPAGQGGASTANDLLNGAGYLSGGIGAYQIGMLDYRSSLPLSSKIGTFSKFSSTYRLLGSTGKILGGASTYVGAPLSIGLDYSAMQNGQISGGRFAYRTTGTLSSIGGGALIGSAYGGPWGAAGGALIGASFVAGEYIYNGATYIWNETLWQISNFENAIKSGWYPGR
jgi:RHS repeat-associated protein